MGSYARQKGHNFEREIAQNFRDMGYEKAKTSRQVSRIADDCKIDIVGIMPYAVQCKNLQEYASANEIAKIEWETYVDSLDSDLREMVPLVLTKAKNKQTLAIIPWSHLKLLIESYKKYARN